MKHNWEYKQLGDICSILMGQSPSSDSYNDESKGLPFFQGCSDFGKIYPSVTKFCSKPIRVAAEKDILFSVRAPIGTMNIANVPCCIGRGLCSFRIHAPNLQKYLFYALNVTKPKIIEKGTGSTFKAVNKDVLFRHIIPVPPLNVQEQIVAELDKINETIEDCRELLCNLDALAQSLFYDFFGDPILNQKGWETNTIEQICISIVRGPFGGALKKEIFVPKSHNTYKVYEQKHAIQKNAQIGTYYICENDFKRLKRFELIPGDIIMSCSGTIGEFFKLPLTAEAGVMNQALLKFSLSDKVDSIYFLFLMKDMKRLFTIYGTGLQNISSVTTVKHVSIPVPPLELQEKFAERIEQIEEQKKIVENTIAELQTLLDSRMDYWFN